MSKLKIIQLEQRLRAVVCHVVRPQLHRSICNCKSFSFDCSRDPATHKLASRGSLLSSAPPFSAYNSIANSRSHTIRYAKSFVHNLGKRQLTSRKISMIAMIRMIRGRNLLPKRRLNNSRPIHCRHAVS